MGRALAGQSRYDEAAEAFGLAQAADEAFGHWVQAAEAATAAGDRQAQGQILAHLALTADQLDDPGRRIDTLMQHVEFLKAAHDEAEVYFRQADDLARAVGDVRRRAHLLARWAEQGVLLTHPKGLGREGPWRFDPVV